MRLPSSEFAVTSGVDNRLRRLVGSIALVVLCFCPSTATGRLSSAVNRRYPGSTKAGQLCGGGSPFFPLSGFFTSSLVSGCLSAAFAVCRCYLRFLIFIFWSAFFLSGVSTTDCVDGEVLRGSGGDVIADAVRGPSLTGVTECFRDVIPVPVVMLRCGCRTDMERGGGKACGVASAT